MLPWHQYLLGVILIIAGVAHFKYPKVYLKIMPPYIPAPQSMVLLSGIIEMILGFMLLNPGTQKIAGWAIIAMLVVFIPVHVYMLQNKKASLKMPTWLLILRFPIQLGLMYWAYQYTL